MLVESNKVDLTQVQNRAVGTETENSRREGRQREVSQWIPRYHLIGRVSSGIPGNNKVNIINNYALNISK